MGSRKSDFICLFVGRLCPLKRVDDLILAVANSRQHDKASLWIVGDGPHRKTLEELARQLNVQAIFFGFKNQSELPRFYAAADILVLPSDRETWGLVVNEALACGRPCVISDRVGCHIDMIVEGITGSVFQCGDVLELGRSLAYWRSRFMNGASNESTEWRSVVERHSPETAARGICTALQEIITST
jgi:glycosyltransferase involved in cell wall biosynthesis